MSHNIETKLDDLIERMEREFQMMLGILGDVLLKILHPLVENVQANQNLGTTDRGVADRTNIPKSSNRLEGHERPLGYPEEPRVEVIPEQEQ